jgi:hypothetical protein
LITNLGPPLLDRNGRIKKSIMVLRSGILIILFAPFALFAQEVDKGLKIKKNHGGLISLGARSTISTFNNGNWSDVGTGVGGQFRLQVHDRINTEWFLDYIRTDIGGLGNKQDLHVGWSVMYYVLKDPGYKRFFKPYILAGHCFDYTNIKVNANQSNFTEKWSAAVQAGVGNHFNLTEHLDLTFIAQYMIHLGGHTEAHVEEGILLLHEHSGVSLEGHLLFTLGVNYKIADLW